MRWPRSPHRYQGSGVSCCATHITAVRLWITDTLLSSHQSDEQWSRWWSPLRSRCVGLLHYGSTSRLTTLTWWSGETLAANRSRWRQLCYNAVEQYEGWCITIAKAWCATRKAWASANTSTTGVGKVRPAGQIRPASSVYPARGGPSVVTLWPARIVTCGMDHCLAFYTHTISDRDSVSNLICYAGYGYKQPADTAPTAAWLIRQHQVASGSPNQHRASRQVSGIVTPRILQWPLERAWLPSSCAPTQRRLLPCLDRPTVVSSCSQRWKSSNLSRPTRHSCRTCISTIFFFNCAAHLFAVCWQEQESLFSLSYCYWHTCFSKINVWLSMAIGYECVDLWLYTGLALGKLVGGPSGPLS